MDTVTRFIPEGFPISLQVVAVTLVLGFLYSVLTRDRPHRGFPIVSLDGLSPRKSWAHHGREVIAKGVAQVCSL